MGIFFQARIWRIIALRRLTVGSHAHKHKDQCHDRRNRTKDSDGNDLQIIAHPVASRRNVGYQYFFGPEKARHQ
jgi:hypothetical protein